MQIGYLILKKTLQLPFIIWGIVTFLFFSFGLLSDPAQMLAGQRADAETLAAIRTELGLDKPLFIQYLHYLHNLSPIDLKLNHSKPFDIELKYPNWGKSFQNQRPVIVLYLSKLGGTVILAITALSIALVIALPAGILAARKPDSWLDKSLASVAALGMASPSFFAATIFIWVFAVQLGWFRTSGYLVQIDALGDGSYYAWQNLFLPAVTLGIRPLAVLFQLTRVAMIEVLAQDYIRTAQASGFSTTIIVFRYALPNAFTPILVGITGWLGALLAGAFYIEVMFDWQGIGKLTVDALYANDYPLILCCAICTGAIFAFLNLTTDVIQTLLNPALQKK